ncbi:MAG: type II toxin-antitoxin system HicA family toxin [Thermodesulfobacteriota bacterium]|nr:type II toxin-antitoxin system HicA family toxin [Thermodesulfobacteriota bacterium]
MSRLTQISFSEFVRKLKKLGFEGPYSGGKHLYMLKGDLRLTIPNPHKQKIGVDLIMKILRQAGITREEWISQ